MTDDDPVSEEMIECPHEGCQKTVTSQRGLSLHITGTHDSDKPWRDEDTVREMYLDNQMTTMEIGDELGCAPGTVANSLDNFGVERRGAFKNDGVYEKPWRDEETFRGKYLDESLTVADIAEEWECDISIIYDWVEKHGIPESEQRAPDWDADDYEYDYRDADDLECLYHEKDLTLREMEDLLGRENTTIRKWMDRHGIERETKHDKRRAPHATFHHDDRGYEGWAATGFGHYDKLRVHRLLAIAEGADPYKVFSGDYHVHHQNGCTFDNRPSNIEFLSESEHISKHAIERWNDPEFREKITEMSRELAKKRPMREEGGFGKGFLDDDDAD